MEQFQSMQQTSLPQQSMTKYMMMDTRTRCLGHEFNQADFFDEHDFVPEDHLSQLDLIPGNYPSQIKNPKGWKICVEWKDGTTSWHPMGEIKNSFPIQLAQYAVTNNLQDELAFCWWVKHTLRKEKCIMAAMNSRYAKCTISLEYKFQVVPKKLFKMIKKQIQIFGLMLCKRN
jgi:hypothetical protein